jgi:polysaccharide biosynthesis transport protein
MGDLLIHTASLIASPPSGDNPMDARNNDFPIQSEYTYGSDGVPVGSSAGPAISVAEILETLRRGWRFPVFGCLVGLTLAASYIVFVPPLYKSTARILLDRSVTRYLQTNKIGDDPTFDDTEIASQVYVLSSESIVVPVVRSMNLAHDIEFVGAPNEGGGNFNKVIELVKRFIDWDDHTDPTIDPDAVLEEIAVENLFKRLSVFREDVANVISVTFASRDANKAANIANAVADTYITTTLETKLKATKLVSQWLQDRLMELKVQVTDADRALQDYKIANNLISTGKGLLNAEQLGNLNTQLTNARIALTEAKMRRDSIQQMAGDGINSAAVTGALTKLRSEYRDLAAKATEMEADVGPRHTAVVKLRQKMDELQKSIRGEEQRIAGSYADEYQIAKARESELAATAVQLAGEAGTSNQAQVKMRELESSADTLRNLYNTFLQKFKEINTIQTETIPLQNARILTRAVPPSKSSKKAAAVLAGGIMVGLFLGAGAAMAREWAAGVCRTPKLIEQYTNIHCVILPRVKANRERTAWSQASAESMLIEEFVLDEPFSRFTETLRHVKALINSAQREHGVKVIGVVSSVPGEGKTTVAANLAALMVASSGARTLIVDSDVHLGTLTSKLAPDAREGLIEAIIDPSRLATLVSKRQRSRLDVLPCVFSDRVPNAGEFLGTPQMEQLLVAARRAYDYVIIEIAPIMSVADLKMIERFIDRFIFVVEWGQTKRVLVQEALSEAHLIRERILAVVLNKVDPFELRRIESYKGKSFRDYYKE